MTGPVQAVLFDLDGTLTDSAEAWDDWRRDYTERCGHVWTATDGSHITGSGGWAQYLTGPDRPGLRSPWVRWIARRRIGTRTKNT